jgi:hypothetical protein
MLPAPTGLSSFLKGPRELGVFTVVYDLHYGTDAVFNVGES